MDIKHSNSQLRDDLTPLLIEIQAGLSQDLNLEVLANRFGYSPFHFQRLFKDLTGESPKKYVERLRIEKAAYLLSITSETVLDIALSLGFQNHETFSRAFKRHIGVTPKGYREASWQRIEARSMAQLDYHTSECRLSEARFTKFKPMTLLAIRHLGDYYDVPDPYTNDDFLWTNLELWADQNSLDYQKLPIALLHDDPNTVAPENQRCDACIQISNPIVTSQNIRCIGFEGGTYATLEHIGPYSTLDLAFEKLATSVVNSKDWQFRDGVVLDVMREVRLDGNRSMNTTDIFLPIERKA